MSGQGPHKDVNILSVAIKLNGELYTLIIDDIMHFHFIEDIYSFCITGKVTIIDREGILEKGPFTGSENDGMTIIYDTDGNGKRTLDFNIFKIERAEDFIGTVAGTNNILTFILVDPMFFKLVRTKYSLSFKEKTIAEIIEHLCEHMLEIELDFFDEDETELELWYIPRWDINTCLKYLMSISEEPYLFYTSTQIPNKFTRHCVKFEELLSNGGLLDVDGDGGLYIFDSDNIYKGSRVKAWNITSIDENARKALQGCFGLGYDFKRKKLLNSHEPLLPEIGFTPGDIHTFYQKFIDEDITILGKKTLFDDISNPDYSFQLYGEDKEEIIKRIITEDLYKRYNLQQQVMIDVYGHEERYAGAMIEIEWPSIIRSDFNKNLKGKYLIKTVVHSFQPRNTQCYTQKLVCIKNGFYESDNSSLVNASKTNL